MGSVNKYRGKLRAAVNHPRHQFRKSMLFPDTNEGKVLARAYVDKYEREYLQKITGHPDFRRTQDFEVLGKKTVIDLIEEYLDKASLSESQAYDVDTAKRIVSVDPIGKMTLAEVSGQDYLARQFFERYDKGLFSRRWKNSRRRQPSSKFKILSTLSTTFNYARQYNLFGVCRSLVSPFNKLGLKGRGFSKSRTMTAGEEEKLVPYFNGCGGLNKYYVPLAMYLALDMALRLQEVANLHWSHCKFETRRVYIWKTKTDWMFPEKGKRPKRIVVMPVHTMSLLIELRHSLHTKGTVPGFPEIEIPNLIDPVENPNTPIFLSIRGIHESRPPRQLTERAITSAFEERVKLAGIRNDPETDEALTFHSMRGTAKVRWVTGGKTKQRLDDMQCTIMMDGMRRAYKSKDLEEYLPEIQDQLDRSVLYHYKIDDKGKLDLGPDEKPIKVPLALAQAVRNAAGKSISNLELVEMGYIPNMVLGQWQVVKIRSYMAKTEQEIRTRMATEHVLAVIIRDDGWGKPYYCTIDQAVKLAGTTEVERAYLTGELLEIDTRDGLFVRPDKYFFVSVKKLIAEGYLGSNDQDNPEQAAAAFIRDLNTTEPAEVQSNQLIMMKAKDPYVPGNIRNK
jgi:integrase